MQINTYLYQKLVGNISLLNVTMGVQFGSADRRTSKVNEFMHEFEPAVL